MAALAAFLLSGFTPLRVAKTLAAQAALALAAPMLAALVVPLMQVVPELAAMLVVLVAPLNPRPFPTRLRASRFTTS